MYCVHCGKEIPDESSFCFYCGNHISNNDTDNQQENKQVDMSYQAYGNNYYQQPANDTPNSWDDDELVQVRRICGWWGTIIYGGILACIPFVIPMAVYIMYVSVVQSDDNIIKIILRFLVNVLVDVVVFGVLIFVFMKKYKEDIPRKLLPKVLFRLCINFWAELIRLSLVLTSLATIILFFIMLHVGIRPSSYVYIGTLPNGEKVLLKSLNNENAKKTAEDGVEFIDSKKKVYYGIAV